MELLELKKIVQRSFDLARDEGLSSLTSQALEKLRMRAFYVLGPSVSDQEYAAWIKRSEPSDAALAAQSLLAKNFNYHPLISIITPVWNPPVGLLAETLKSVVVQTYENWELCIVDGGSRKEVRDYLTEFAKQNENTRIEFLETNLGISANSNKALDLARGDFFTFLDHDDLLAPFALFDVVSLLNQNAESAVIYSDSDRMLFDGKRIDPLFKPDWSPDMMFSVNYLTHLCVLSSTLTRSLGGFRPETDGAQDWDLFLRATERCDKIAHVPKVLYHWREAPSSVSAVGFHAKPYAKTAQLRVVDQCLERNQLYGKAQRHACGALRVKWKLPDNPLVSVIVTGTNETVIRRCVSSVKHKSSYKNFEIIVVTPDQMDLDIREVRSVPLHARFERYAAYNEGAKNASGKVLVFLDSLTEVSSADWLEELTGWASNNEVGVVGCMILTTNHRILHGGIVIGLSDYLFRGAREVSSLALGHTEWFRDLNAVSGLCLATPREIFSTLGGFDTNLESAADIGYCLSQQRIGRRVVYTPHAKLTMLEEDLPRQRKLNGFPQYPQIISAGDQYFNENLSFDHPIPTLE
ncbi:MAG: glycosyltransferase [Candidatus Bathyarchaeia archaeon]|jgi:glycosyltransferase involved in cell wall biosynthesis